MNVIQNKIMIKKKKILIQLSVKPLRYKDEI